MVEENINSFNLNLCYCGCKEFVNKKFKRGHNSKGRSGITHYSWKGGRKLDTEGYVLIWKPDHPRSNKNGYIKEHRLVYEEYYKCCLLPYTIIHHKDHNIKNNSINNLIAISSSYHNKIHKMKDFTNFVCLLCGSNKTGIRSDINRPQWLRYKDGYICKKCYDKNRWIKKKSIKN